MTAASDLEPGKVQSCGNEQPHAEHAWHGIAKLQVGTKYGDWVCPGWLDAEKAGLT